MRLGLGLVARMSGQLIKALARHPLTPDEEAYLLKNRAQLAREAAQPLQAPAPTVNEGPSLWAQITPALKARISEKNWEVWLSSLLLVEANESRLVLACPNTFFQEYLAEHYTEVIQEVILHEHNKFLEIEFTVPGEISTPAKKEDPPPPVEPPKPEPETLEELAAVELEEDKQTWVENTHRQKQISYVAHQESWSYNREAAKRQEVKELEALWARERAITRRKRREALEARLKAAALLVPPARTEAPRTLPPKVAPRGLRLLKDSPPKDDDSS